VLQDCQVLEDLLELLAQREPMVNLVLLALQEAPAQQEHQGQPGRPDSLEHRDHKEPLVLLEHPVQVVLRDQLAIQV